MDVDHGLPSSSFMRVITSSRLPTCAQPGMLALFVPLVAAGSMRSCSELLTS